MTTKEIELLLRARDAASGALTAVTTSLRGLDTAQDQVVAGAPGVQASLVRLGNAARAARSAVSSGRSGFLGLQPFQLQNLSFQINDVFTQIASGTSVTQTLAQQGGQIIQIFPQAIGALLRFVPALALVGLALAPVVTAFQELGEVQAAAQARAAARLEEMQRAAGKTGAALQYLTAAEREQVHALRDVGREAEATALQTQLFERRMNETARQARGPWAEAFATLGAAWRDVTTGFGATDRIEHATDEVDQLALSVQTSINLFRILGRLVAGQGLPPPLKTAAPIETASPEAAAETEAKIKGLAQAQADAAAEAERDAERAAARAAAAHEEFRQHLTDLEFEAELIGQSAEQQEILTALRQAELDAREAGLELSQQEYAALHRQILLLQDARRKAEEAEGAAAKNAEAELEVIRKKQRAAEEAARSVERLNERIAGGLTDAIDDAIAGTQSLGDAFREFAAEFLREIAKMILQQAILNALQAAQKSNPYVAAAAAVVGSLHSGGIVGSARPSRRTSPGLFANAIRYHGGGFAGLRPGEVPAVLRRNEEVLTEDNPRHAFNAGAQKPQALTINNLLDAGELASKMLGTSEGERAVMNVIGANRMTIRGILS